MEEIKINQKVIESFVNSWPERAGVRKNDFEQSFTEYDPTIPDYPLEMLPFHNHPCFLRLPFDQRQQILTWAWLIYNERVITAEDRVANPAFALLIQGTFPGAAKNYSLKKAIQQCLIDEHYHSLIHMMAIQKTKQLREVEEGFPTPASIIYRRLLENQSAVTEEWEKLLLTLVWTVVSEISINAYLSLLSTNHTIQPMHKTVAALHNRDELAHGSLVVEAAKSIYINMNDKQKTFFITKLPKALHAFGEHDYTAWDFILKNLDIADHKTIIKDCESNSSNRLLVRDFSGLKELAEELNIINQIEFDFSSN